MLISDNARLTVTNSELTRNTASHPTRGYGGAALNIDSLLAFVDSRINDNSGGVGGALYSGSGGVLRLTRTTVCSNVATVSGGGGIATQNDNAVVSVTDSTICQNTAQTTGGGLWFEDGTELTATGSTISSNVASKVRSVPFPALPFFRFSYVVACNARERATDSRNIPPGRRRRRGVLGDVQCGAYQLLSGKQPRRRGACVRSVRDSSPGL